jgi:hypothetical protein
MMEMLGYKNKAKEKEEATNAENQAIKELLQQGCQVWQVAARLGRSEQLVKYRLRENKALRDCLSPTKSGKWEHEEIELLIELRMREWKYSAISKKLGRTASSIASQVVKHADQIFGDRSPLTSQETKALSPDLVDSIVQGRLQDIWDGLMSCNMTKAWREALSSESAEPWLSDIARGIPVKVKEVLANHGPHNIAILETLPWTETTDAGVYGWLLKPKPKLYFDSECQLYVGSTSRYGYGLEGRKSQHLSKNPREHNRRLWYMIREKGLKPEGQFITLTATSMKAAEGKEALRMRYLVTLAEAIFTVWLGALNGKPENRNVHILCPWDIQKVSYSGCSSHNPLAKDIIVPKGCTNSVCVCVSI